MTFRNFALAFAVVASGAAATGAADAASVRVYPLSASGYMPAALVRAADGSIWFSAAKLTPCHGNVTCQTEELGTLRGSGTHEIALGPVTTAGTFGVTPGPGRTLWFTDALKAAYVFDLSGKPVATVDVRTGNGDGALSAPFVGPDGRMWFAQGSFGQGAVGVVAVDRSYKIRNVAPCAMCFFSGGVVAADGDAWFLDPYLGGFYRVTAGGALRRFDYGHFELDTMLAGPDSGLWGLQNNDIATFDLAGHLRATFVPKIPVQSGLSALGGDLVWANFGPSQAGGNELDVARMTPAGKGTVARYANVGPCRASDAQWFSSGPAIGGDGALYVAIGCSPLQAPYTDGGRAAIVRIPRRPVDGAQT